MILTTCAACAKPLEHDAPARCVNCQTRYCSDRCLRYHAHRGGHDDKCEEIARGGGAEPYHAEKKYEEAVADAVEECADDTEGQTCYICLEGGSEEGLVRGCACRGAAGFAHVSCLARQAQVAVDIQVGASFGRWNRCGLCEQEYHGVVACALGWACWKTYVGRPEGDWTRAGAMNVLGNGLFEAKRHDEALSVQEAELTTDRRLGASEANILAVQTNLSNTYYMLGRLEEAGHLHREIYSGRLKLQGEEDADTLTAGNNYAASLLALLRCEEARSLLRNLIPVARRVLGENNELTLKVKDKYARSLYKYDGATLDDLREAVTTFEATERIARRVLGGAHPLTKKIENGLREAQAALYARGLP